METKYYKFNDTPTSYFKTGDLQVAWAETNLTDALLNVCSKEEYDYCKDNHNINIPNIDPTTNQIWASIAVRDTYFKEQVSKIQIIDKADKGQEAENAIELNDAIKYYITKLIRDNDFDIKSDLLEIALNNTDITKQTKFNNDMKTRKAYIRMLNNVEEFERSIAIATNSDPTHPVSWIGENDFVNILSHIAIEDKPRYAEIAKLLNIEATYEPEAVKNEYIRLQQIVNNHIAHPTPTIDGNTLANEMPKDAGGTQTK